MPFVPQIAHSLYARGLAIIAALLVSTAPMLAQTAPTQKSSQPQRPTTRSQPAQPQNSGPIVVNLKASPAQPEWTKVCGKDQNSNADICYTTRDFLSDKDQPVLAVALYDVKGKQSQKLLRLLMPLGMLIQPGIRIAIDQGQATAGRYASCLPNGCFAEARVKNDFVTALKKDAILKVSARNQIGREVTFAVSTGGFGKAFDGPAIDPKVLEEQQRKMQEELKRRSDELRQRLMSNSGAPVQAPATNAETAEPKP